MNLLTGLSLEGALPTSSRHYRPATLLLALLLISSEVLPAACPGTFDDFLVRFTVDPEFASSNVHRKFTAKERLIDSDGRTAKTNAVEESSRIYNFGGRAYPGPDVQREMQVSVKLGLSVAADVRVVRHESALTGERINYGFRRVKGCWKLWYKEYVVESG